jgi:(R,R)-butanediol dehydrogenase/meso-butanediol dehydrogenase/diacetyl reductase
MVQPDMKAALFFGAKDVRLGSAQVPVPLEHELLIQVTSAGICGTDAHEFDSGPHMFPGPDRHPRTAQELPMVIGHEFAGRVVGFGSAVRGFSNGELVACGAGVSCGVCVRCARGQSNLCESYWTVGLQRNGGLAEFVTAPAEICFSTEEFGLSQDLAGLAQPVSIAVHALSRGRISVDDHVVIVGAGGIGAFLVRAAAGACGLLGVVDPNSERLAIAEQNGATFTTVSSEESDIEQTKKEWGMSPNLVFEVSGTRKGLEAAMRWLEPGGRLVVVGLQGGKRDIDFRSLSLNEYEILGTNAHVAHRDMPRALELLSSGGAWSQIAPEILPLDRIVSEGLSPLANGQSKSIKTLFDPSATQSRPTEMKVDKPVNDARIRRA